MEILTGILAFDARGQWGFALPAQALFVLALLDLPQALHQQGSQTAICELPVLIRGPFYAGLFLTIFFLHPVLTDVAFIYFQF